MPIDCKRPEMTWSILYRVTGKSVLMKRIVKPALKHDEITQKYNPSQSASVDKSLEQ